MNLDEFLCRFWLCSWNEILKINEKNIVGTGTPFTETGSLWEQSKYKLHPMLTHDTGQPHPIAAKQIVSKIFLDPHLTKCRWGTPILGISTLWRPKICMMIVGERIYGCLWRTTLRQFIIINQCSPPYVNNNNKQSTIQYCVVRMSYMDINLWFELH